MLLVPVLMLLQCAVVSLMYRSGSTLPAEKFRPFVHASETIRDYCHCTPFLAINIRVKHGKFSNFPVVRKPSHCILAILTKFANHMRSSKI